jgi:hypothetical protein
VDANKNAVYRRKRYAAFLRGQGENETYSSEVTPTLMTTPQAA